MIKFLTQGLILLAFFSFTNNTYAQKYFTIGILGQLEKSRHADIRPIVGFSVSKMFSSNLEIEVEVFYRTLIDKSLIVLVPLPPNDAGTVRYHLKHEFLTIPILAGYKSKSINVSLGPTADIFLGLNNKGYSADPSNTPASPISSDKFDKKLLLGAKIKIGKTIKLTDRVFLDPYIFVNPVFTKYSFISGYHSYSKQFWGLTIPVKFNIQ
jgi:hypothetical protein